MDDTDSVIVDHMIVTNITEEKGGNRKADWLSSSYKQADWLVSLYEL